MAFAMTLRSLRTEKYDVCKLDILQLHKNEEFCLAILTPYFSRGQFQNVGNLLNEQRKE